MAIEEVVRPGKTGNKQDEELTQEELELCQPVIELCQQNDKLHVKAKELATKQKRNSLAAKAAKVDAKKMRVRLAQHLFEMKEKLGGKGRDSKFGAFLKLANMNRMQAGRLIKEHLATTEEKCNKSETVTLPELTPAAIDKLVTSLASKCRCVTTLDGVDRVLSKLDLALRGRLEALRSEASTPETGAGIKLCAPSPARCSVPEFTYEEDYA